MAQEYWSIGDRGSGWTSPHKKGNLRAVWSENGICSLRREPPEPEAVTRAFAKLVCKEGLPPYPVL